MRVAFIKDHIVDNIVVFDDFKSAEKVAEMLGVTPIDVTGLSVSPQDFYRDGIFISRLIPDEEAEREPTVEVSTSYLKDILAANDMLIDAMNVPNLEPDLSYTEKAKACVKAKRNS